VSLAPSRRRPRQRGSHPTTDPVTTETGTTETGGTETGGSALTRLTLASADHGSKPRHAIVATGSQRIRLEIRPDQTHGWVTILTPSDASAVGVATVRRAIESITPTHDGGLLRTAVLTERDATPFLANGFAVVLRLHVLTHDLAGVAPNWSLGRRLTGQRLTGRRLTGQRLTGRRATVAASDVRFRRMRSTDLDSLLAVDQAAFTAIDGVADDEVARGWTSRISLDEAMSATPSTRATVALIGDRIVGFAISGRAQRAGYLQRLAVSPDAQGAGIGSALITDCLSWCRRHRVVRVAVNTQVGNTAAMRRYVSMGFSETLPSLVICERHLSGNTSTDSARS
jgi:GNAT superfamily N-acetyltransferase